MLEMNMKGDESLECRVWVMESTLKVEVPCEHGWYVCFDEVTCG